MMDGGKLPAQSYKIRVHQEYEVEIYYQEGIHVESDETLNELVAEDALDLIENADGLVALLHEETRTENGYIAHVTTFDPKIELVYNIPDMTMTIKRQLSQRGIKK